MAISKLNPVEGGIPKGNTDNRSVEFPSPQIGDVYYNGELEILEIWNGTAWVAVSAPPATPQIISVTNAVSGDSYTTSTAGELEVSFQPGSGGGTPSQYNAFTTAGGFSASNSTTTVTITGLTLGTAYTVYGNGQNNFGTTTNTPNAAPVTPSTKPQAPTIGTASTSNVTSDIAVTWTLGSNGGSPLTAITVTPYLNGTTAQASQNAATISSTSMTFTGLTAGSSYTFKVKTTNANGDSPETSATNSVTVPFTIALNYLVIAGGGAGGGGNSGGGGGGGAGGYRTSVGTSGANSSAESQLTLLSGTNYSVVIGSGGAGLPAQNGEDGNKGSNSTFSTITSAGGGGGVGGGTSPTLSGGGSGGGANVVSVAGSGTTNQGRNGGTGQNSNPNYAGGGGGGASGQGANGIAGSTGGNGGAGLASDITGTSVTRAGGGGGGAGRESAGAANIPGGTGQAGGGNGAPSSGATIPAGNATANTGSGGGGAGYNPTSTPTGAGSSGSGGSGIVILRYPDTRTITIGAGLTGTESSASGGFKRATITAGSGNVSWS